MEAVRKAGYSERSADSKAEELWNSTQVLQEIALLAGKQVPAGRALRELERLACGSPETVAKSLFTQEEPTAYLNKLDLGYVASVKVTTDGDVEVKFFDRLKALELLLSLENGETAGGDQLYSALEHSAALLEKRCDGGAD